MLGMIDARTRGPGYWMDQASGVLRPAIEAYLTGGDMTRQQVALLRVYLRQWINAPVWFGPTVMSLRRTVDDLHDRRSIDRWLDRALDAGIDPL